MRTGKRPESPREAVYDPTRDTPPAKPGFCADRSCTLGAWHAGPCNKPLEGSAGFADDGVNELRCTLAHGHEPPCRLELLPIPTDDQRTWRVAGCRIEIGNGPDEDAMRRARQRRLMTVLLFLIVASVAATGSVMIYRWGYREGIRQAKEQVK